MKTKPTSKTCGYTKMVFSSALRFRFRTLHEGPDHPDCPAGARIVKGRTLCGTLTAVLLGLLALPPTGSTDTQTLSECSAFPPFMSATVQPNILLILDNSGSMNEFAIHVGQEKGGKIYVQQSTGSIEELVMRTPFGQKSGSVLWYED